MSITHAMALRSAIADLVDSYVNAGSGTAKLRIRDGSTTVVDFDLDDPAFGAASSGIITLASTPIAAQAAAAGAEVDNFHLLDKDGTVVLSGSVTATGGGGDIEVTNTNIAQDQDCELDSLTYTAPA